MSDELVIRFAAIDDVPLIGYLAQQIWPGTYKEILNPGQVDYMMNMNYSPAALDRQISDQRHQFLIVELNEEPVGFASYSKVGQGIYKLHKIYVHPKTQGKGIGKALVDFIIEQLQETDPAAATLQLNVNRYNKAKHFYERLGFAVVREEDIDIGNNYFMNDYVMEKPVRVNS